MSTADKANKERRLKNKEFLQKRKGGNKNVGKQMEFGEKKRAIRQENSEEGKFGFCWNCGENGHARSYCKNPTNHKAVESRRLSSQECFKCRKVGHTANQCREGAKVQDLGMCFNCGKNDHRLSRALKEEEIKKGRKRERQ
eukprot:TRINITY_DN4948_c0_g1_i11.p1 TRINITY_DN4948_c0_g1~~TRINITY_DN4948_c0_g1_i11.p1  ORF type:complete len:141 (+),score=51.49 TRINITY_DN4948_c0_g1_i11:101-523(+)